MLKFEELAREIRMENSSATIEQVISVWDWITKNEGYNFKLGCGYAIGNCKNPDLYTDEGLNVKFWFGDFMMSVYGEYEDGTKIDDEYDYKTWSKRI